MNLEIVLRLFLPAALALAVAFSMDRLSAARGLLPPGFREPWRRSLAAALVALILWIAAFASLGSIGMGTAPDLSQLTIPRLFLLHALLVAVLVAWFLLGYAGVGTARRPRPEEPVEVPVPGEPPADRPSEPAEPAPAAPRPSLGRQFLAQFGFLAPNVPKEIGLGLVLGLGAWGAVLVAAFAVGLLVWLLGGAEALPQQPPELVGWIAALPVGARLLVSLSAGVVEETFFRGFLQPRVGIVLSSALFVLAHFSYGQPLMLVGIATLSVIYALLVRWRQTIWPAIAAHTLFDAVQLLVVIPAALRYIETEGGKAAALLVLGN